VTVSWLSRHVADADVYLDTLLSSPVALTIGARYMHQFTARSEKSRRVWFWLFADNTESSALTAGNRKLHCSFVFLVVEDDEPPRGNTEEKLSTSGASWSAADYFIEVLDERDGHLRLALGARGIERFIHLVHFRFDRQG
jgi:hypothetical protein